MTMVVREKRKLMNPETGETVDVVALVPEVKDRGFTKVFDLFATELLRDLGLMNGEARLLLLMLAKLKQEPVQGEGWLRLPVEEIAKALACSRSTAFRYLRRLKQKGYIEQDRPGSYLWRIKPELVYRGILAKYFDEEGQRFIEKIREGTQGGPSDAPEGPETQG